MRVLLFIIAMSFSFTAFSGGPWTHQKGKGYYKLSEWWLVFDQHYTDQGLIDPNLTTGIFNTTLYAEYGLTDRLTGIVNAPIFSRNYTNNLISFTTNEVLIPGEALNSVGDVDLAIKYAITRPGSSIPVSATLQIGIPTGKTGGGSLGNLQTGDGEFNQMIRLDAGKGFQIGGNNSYASVYAGFNHRTKGFSEELRFGVEFGIALLESRLWLTGRINAVESLKNGDTAETTTSASIFANNTEFISPEFEVSYYFTDRFGVSASFSPAFRGEIIAAAPSYSVGVFMDLTK